jgi:hypothetical protein
VQISRLRRKLKVDPDGPDLIRTVRGGGYVFAANVAAVETGAMRQWRLDGLNSLATRIAVTMVLAILLSVALTIALVIGYALERQRSPDGDRDFRVFVDRFGVLMLNRHLNLPMISSRLATAAQAVGGAAPADRPIVMAAIADRALQIEIRDAPTLQTGETDVRLDRLRRLICYRRRLRG